MPPMATKGMIEMDGDDYIVVRANERIRCHNLETLNQVLLESGWTAVERETTIEQFRGGLLDSSAR